MVIKISYRIKKRLLYIICLALCFYSTAQIFNPEIGNYGIEDYGADNQNWGIDVDNEGIVYVANNKGLLRYNGKIWQLFELPNKTIVRSVLIVKNIIYTGSYEEFGFWKNDDFGNLSYTSLTHLFEKTHKFKSDEFWQIIQHNKAIIFRSFASIYIYNENKILSVPNSQDVSSITIYDNKLLVGNLKNGLQELINGKLEPFVVLDENYNFNSITNAVSDTGKKLFFFDTTKGGYIYNSHQLSPLPKKINVLLDTYILNKTVFLDNDRIAFGTIKKGVIIYNLKNQDIQYIHKELGLYNNTILGLVYIKKKLWCALDNGISSINLDGSYLYYKDHTGTLETVYDVAFFNNKYYLASNTGLYSFTDDNKLRFISGSEGHIWNLTVLENQLFCSHNNGTFYLENENLYRIGQNPNGVFGYFDILNKKHWYLQGTYNGINLLRKIHKEWLSKPIKNIDFPVNNIVFESKFVIWATHPYKGMYQIQLTEDYTEASQIIYYGDNKNFHQYKTRIYTINDTIVFNNSNKWFQYFKNQDSIGVYKNFQKFKGKNLIKKENNGTWFIDENATNGITYFNKKHQEVLKIDVMEIKKRLVSKYEKIRIKDDSIRTINLYDGFAVFNINKLKKKADKNVNLPVINKIYSNRKGFSVKDSIVRFPFKDAQYLSFEIYTPGQYENNHTYSLSGKIEQQELVKNGKLTLQNLDYGAYVLSIKNEGYQDKGNPVKHFHFKVLPPWYLSMVMRVVYFLLVLGLLFLGYKINKTKIRKQKLALKRLHIEKMQKRITQLEKQNLEKEIKAKKRDLINITDATIRKNEAIMVMINELERLSEVSPNLSRTKKILRMSRKDISAANVWKIFESNFNELNQDFFNKLIAVQPKLTTKDLRLSAYIKTGLTSKKIASLMGISIRGVEIHRYRLRKKLDIDVKDNLANFLRKI
jgi:AraC family chitin signaling transcriptional activator